MVVRMVVSKAERRNQFSYATDLDTMNRICNCIPTTTLTATVPLCHCTSHTLLRRQHSSRARLCNPIQIGFGQGSDDSDFALSLFDFFDFFDFFF